MGAWASGNYSQCHTRAMQKDMYTVITFLLASFIVFYSLQADKVRLRFGMRALPTPARKYAPSFRHLVFGVRDVKEDGLIPVYYHASATATHFRASLQTTISNPPSFKKKKRKKSIYLYILRDRPVYRELSHHNPIQSTTWGRGRDATIVSKRIATWRFQSHWLITIYKRRSLHT